MGREANMTKLKVLDLFSGIGGFSLGLDRAGGFETVAFCEIEPFPRRVLAKHWPEVPCYEDVTKLTGDILKRDGISVDVITGGFPCQDISVAGKQAGIGEGTRSGLWSECLRLISELQPEYAIFENVTNLLSGPSEQPGAWFSRILTDLADVGYDAEWHNIPASYVGAWHRRSRVWILAYRNQVDSKRFCFQPMVQQQHIQGESARVFKRWPGRPQACKSGILREFNGIPDRSHRVAACGNSVVPQIPELIGRAIMEAEKANT
jgi:DNA (cytosine-5)-methyltransferase 1